MVLIRYFRNHFKPEIYGYGYAGLFRQGMAEAPAATMAMIICPLVVLIANPVCTYLCEKTGNGKKRFLTRYMVYRYDEERLDWLILPPKLDAEVKELRAKSV